MAFGKPKWIGQLIQSYQITKQVDRRIGLILLGWFLLGGVLGAGLSLLLLGGNWIFAVITGVMFGLVAALYIFGRRAQAAAYSQIEGQPGAAAAALEVLKRGWRSDPAVAFNKHQDLVHRVVGPPGIVLVGEGSPTRLKSLLASERKKHERVAADAPVHEVIVGYGEDEVPLPKLVRHLTKMKRQVKPAEITEILGRLKALDATRGNMPLPKGPVPTSMKGYRGQMRGR